MMQFSRAKCVAIILFGLLLCAGGILALLAGEGKNGFDTLPLGWFPVMVLAPMVSVGCVVCMVRGSDGSRWWFFLGILLTLPQLFVCLVAVRGTVHYLFQ